MPVIGLAVTRCELSAVRFYKQETENVEWLARLAMLCQTVMMCQTSHVLFSL